MKMFFFIYPDYFDKRVTNELKQAGFRKYTKVHGTTGEGEETDAKLGTHYAPGKNNSLFMAVSDEDVSSLLEIVQKLRQQYPTGGFRAFTFPLEECI